MTQQYYIIPVDSVKEGDILIPDDGFDCMVERCEKCVKSNAKGELYVDCVTEEDQEATTHLLDGQIDYYDPITFDRKKQEDGGVAHYVGFLKKQP